MFPQIGTHTTADTPAGVNRYAALVKKNRNIKKGKGKGHPRTGHEGPERE
jgi:hypothetical protein